MQGKWCFDIEASGFLDETTVDYTASPWKLKDNFVVHCIVAINVDTKEIVNFVQEDCYTKFRPWVKDNVDTIIAHNGINYDLMVCQAAFGMEFTLGFEGVSSTWDGKDVGIIDTYVLSKTLFPDRAGHSIEYFGSILGEEKIDWRQKAIDLGLIEYNSPKGAEFKQYHPEMLVYNERDVSVNIKTYHYLMKEWGDWKWDNAFELEQYVAWIVTRQSHRGFWFDKELAIKNVQELDALMENHRQIVEPHLPEKPLGKTKLKEFTPPATQFKKDETPSAHIIKWVEKHGGKITKTMMGYCATLYGSNHYLPIMRPVKTHEPASISDSTFIKGFLVNLGWEPTNVKEKDLTLDSKKKKLSPEKFAETVERYVEQTLNSPFCKIRLEKVGATRSTLKAKLLRHDLSKPLKVLTNPTFTVGQEKQIDPTLEEMNSQFPYVQNIVEWLTYNHRRNSILGGGFDLDEEDEAETGFLPNVREDGRIPTPADTCGAATGRMKHKLVCNIPRVTSLYGEPIRRLFGVGNGKDTIQFAFDFASLEAMIEAHYCWKWDTTEDKSYCNSLIQEKPNDVHTKTAKVISELLGKDFSRSNAKSTKYACAYGAQAAKIAKTVGCDLATGETVFDAYWQAAKPLADFKTALTRYWETVGKKKYIIGLDGRKISSRSKHSLVNSAFQSAGVICAKRSAVYQDVEFRKLGIDVNFWLEDWKNKPYVQSLIMYHDECQMEVKHGLIKYKKFETEEDRKSWINTQDEEWLKLDTPKGLFAARSIVVDICRKSVEDTSKFYKLNVQLAIDPQFGLEWASCH